MSISIMDTVLPSMTLVAAAVVFIVMVKNLMNYLSREKNTSIVVKDKVITLEVYAELSDIEKRELFKNTNDKDLLVKLLEEKINNEASENFISDLKINVENKLESIEKENSITKYYAQITTRLKDELFALKRRSDLSLIIGITTTAIGLAFLGYFAISFETNAKNMFEFSIEFLPRLFLVVFIQIFAYFFLRLYKLNLNEIKYIQNEITSIESRLLAIRISIEYNDEKSIKYIVEELMKTERNFILNKGQTTMDIEKMKLDQSTNNEMLGKLSTIFKGK